MEKKSLTQDIPAVSESGLNSAAAELAQNEGKFLWCFFYILGKFATLLYLGLIIITATNKF